jgi:xanthine dehydrogenase accessory factor
MIDKTDSSPEVFLKVDELIDQKENFALALVLKAEGSTPRKAGIRAVIFDTGKIFGTLGGGVVEAQTQSIAVESCKSKKSVLFDMQLHGADRQDDVPICGGSMSILIDPDLTGHKTIFKQVTEALKNRTKGVLLTTINETQTSTSSVEPKLQVDYQWYPHDSIPTKLGFPGRENITYCLNHDTAQLFEENQENPSVKKKVFVEPIIPKPLLVIAGGGHIGQALALDASLAGFDVTVFDDRPEFTNPELFPKEAKTICGNIPHELDKISVNKDTYIVIVTRGHKDDAATLEACIKKPFNYIGMIGSRRKVALIRENFIKTGLCTEEEFDRIFTPIGFDIGAVTVPEIAVSITAELIAVRRKGLIRKPWNYEVS